LSFAAPPAGRALLEGCGTMHDEMNDLAPALLMTVIVAVGLVAFQFRAELLATPAKASTPKIEKKADKAPSQITFNDRLYGIR
jgi:hypothetical protein